MKLERETQYKLTLEKLFGFDFKVLLLTRNDS